MAIGAVKAAELIRVSDVPFDVVAESRAGWNIEFCQVEAGANAARLSHLQLDGLSIGRERIEKTVFVRGAIERGTVNLAIADSDDARLTFRGRRMPDNALVYQGPGESIDSHFSGGIINLAIEPQLLERLVEPARLREIMQGDHLLLPRVVAAQLRTFCREALLAFEGRPEVADATLACGRLRMQAAARIADSLQSVFRDDSPKSTRADATDRINAAKRAEAYAVANLDRPISMADLRDHTGVSERTLRSGFVERFGHGPKKHVTLLRLSAARAALRAANARESSVTQIAMQHGFWHLSRFARTYSTHFGELPSESLRTPAG